MNPGLTVAQRRLIQDTFAALRQDAGPLATLFYGRLFACAPELRMMFRGDIRAQGEKLMATLAACVASLDDIESMRPQLRELGRRHVTYGTRPEHYPLAAKALLWSLGQALEHRFDTETKQAWAAVLAEISSEMQAGANFPE